MGQKYCNRDIDHLELPRVLAVHTNLLNPGVILNLNVKKTKEMIADYSKSINKITPVNVEGDKVELVEEYKYLGNIIDHKLKGNLNP